MTPDRYSRSVAWSATDECFVALCSEFPDLSGVGDTRAEAEAALDEALAAAIEIANEEGWPLPAPRTIAESSGQFRVRLPRTLHAQLSERAAFEDVSLNQLVSTMLAAQLSGRTAVTELHRELQREMRAMVQDARSVAQDARSAVQDFRVATLGGSTPTTTADVSLRSDREVPRFPVATVYPDALH